MALTHIGIANSQAVNFSHKNGPRIKSGDGNFELGLNGRSHFDAHWLYPDQENPDYPAFGSQLLHGDAREGFNWRENLCHGHRKNSSRQFQVRKRFRYQCHDRISA